MPHDTYPTLRHYFQGFWGGKQLIDRDEVGEVVRLLTSADVDITGPAQLKSYLNEVIGGSEVTMPPAVAGMTVVVVNSTGALINVHAYEGDNFSDHGVLAPLAFQAPNRPAIYYAYDTGVWLQLAGIVGSAGEVTDAPLDGRVYGRKGSIADWVAWTVSPVTFGPNDGYAAPLDVILIDGGVF